MSLFKRALGAVGAAGAAVTNKYIDEQLAQQRAQFMADLQRQTAGQIRSDDLAFRTDPGNLQRVNDAERTTLLARGSATREAEMAGMNHAEYQGARRRVADDDAAAETQRAVSRAEAMTPVEVDRARQVADIQGRMRAKWDRSGPGKQTIGDKIKEMEDAIGRPLSQAEREGVVGLGGKPANDPSKQALDAVLEGVKNQTIKPEDVGRQVNTILRSLRVVEQERYLQSEVQKAMAEGKLPESIAILREAGASDQQLLAAGVPPAQLKTATPEPEKPGGGLLRRGRLEKTTTPDGKTVYRMPGTTQWYPTEREALSAGDKPAPRPAAPDVGGLMPAV